MRDTRTRWRRLPVAALVGAGLGMVAYAVTKPDDSPERVQPPSRSAQASPGAGLDPAALRWSDHFGMALPVSATDGPRDLQKGLAQGFAHTPVGALLAAVHIAVRSAAQWGPAVFEPTISQQMIGPERDVMQAACRDFYERERAETGVAEGAPLGRGHAVIEAYRWRAYSPGLAVVDVVSAGPGRHGITVRASTRVQLQWVNDDWRVLAPPGGDWRNSAAAVTSTAGYTLFPRRR